MITIDPTMAGAMNLPSNQHGALVASITSGSPAATAGIEAGTTNLNDNGEEVTVGGDLIIAYNGQTVSGADDLIADLANEGVVGQSVTLTILRSGKQLQVQVTPGIRPSS